MLNRSSLLTSYLRREAGGPGADSKIRPHQYTQEEEVEGNLGKRDPLIPAIQEKEAQPMITEEEYRRAVTEMQTMKDR